VAIRTAAPPRDSTRLSLALNGSGPDVLAGRVGSDADNVDAAAAVLAVAVDDWDVDAVDVDNIVVDAVDAEDSVVAVVVVVVAFTKDVTFA
jgi:hypothetical protein